MNDEDFTSLGLTSLQADVMCTLLELGGEASAPGIIDRLSERQKVNRTSIYGVLTKLQQMGIIISNDERSSNYALISTSVETLLDFLSRQHQQEVDLLKLHLQEAKARQKKSQEFELYYFRTRDQILSQLDLILGNPTEYILLMANAPVLQSIYPQIEEIAAEETTSLLVVPTWNPDPELDFQGLIKKYQDLLSKDFVAKPLPIFDRIKPMMSKYLQNYPDLVKLNSQNCFVLVLSPNQFMMATYLNNVVQNGSGIYTREPMISQTMQILFMSIFENLSYISENVIDGIMELKTKETMKAYINEFMKK